MSEHLPDAEQPRPVIGVFLLVDLDHMDSQQPNQTLCGDDSPSQVFAQTVAQLAVSQDPNADNSRLAEVRMYRVTISIPVIE